MKNKLIDLNNHLFAALERLNDEDLKGENLAQEIDRSQAISKLSTEIVNNAALALKAKQLKQERLISATPEMIGHDTNGS